MAVLRRYGRAVASVPVLLDELTAIRPEDVLEELDLARGSRRHSAADLRTRVGSRLNANDGRLDAAKPFKGTQDRLQLTRVDLGRLAGAAMFRDPGHEAGLMNDAVSAAQAVLAMEPEEHASAEITTSVRTLEDAVVALLAAWEAATAVDAFSSKRNLQRVIAFAAPMRNHYLFDLNENGDLRIRSDAGVHAVRRILRPPLPKLAACCEIRDGLNRRGDE